MTFKLDSLFKISWIQASPFIMWLGCCSGGRSMVGGLPMWVCINMLNKVFVAADTPQGSFNSGLAAILEKSSEEAGMYLICLYSGEDVQWPFKVIGQRAISIPLTYHNDASGYESVWWEYHSRCFHILLQMSGGGHVILPSQLTGIPSLAKAVFEMKWEYGPCCLLFKSGEPFHFVLFEHDGHHSVWFLCISLRHPWYRLQQWQVGSR